MPDDPIDVTVGFSHLAVGRDIARFLRGRGYARMLMRRVIDGLPNKLIADQLGISVRTVEVHRARVFEKMGVKSAVELSNLLRNSAP